MADTLWNDIRDEIKDSVSYENIGKDGKYKE